MLLCYIVFWCLILCNIVLLWRQCVRPFLILMIKPWSCDNSPEGSYYQSCIIPTFCSCVLLITILLLVCDFLSQWDISCIIMFVRPITSLIWLTNDYCKLTKTEHAQSKHFSFDNDLASSYLLLNLAKWRLISFSFFPSKMFTILLKITHWLCNPE
jgi:hypothetical protein